MLLSEANRMRKRGREKNEGEVPCAVCGNPIPQLANFCPLCGHPRASTPQEELFSRPTSEPPIGDVPEVEAMPEEEIALPPPSAVAPEGATGSPPAPAPHPEPEEEAPVPEAGGVAEAPVSPEPTEESRKTENQGPLTRLAEEYYRRFNKILELGRMLRGFDLGSDTYASLSRDVLRSLEAFRAELQSKLDEGLLELDELETNRVELQISVAELERRRETEGLPSDAYEEELAALRSSLEETEKEIKRLKLGLKDLEECVEIDGKYKALCTRYPDLFKLESRIEAVQEKEGSRGKAVEALFSEAEVEIQPPVETEAAPEVTVIGEVRTEMASTPPPPELRAPLQRPIQKQGRELLVDVPEKASQLVPIWLRRGDLIGIRFTPLKHHLVSPISAMIFTREAYAKLQWSGKPVSRKILESYANSKTSKGEISYTSELEDFHYLLLLNSSSKPERVSVRYEIGSAER